MGKNKDFEYQFYWNDEDDGSNTVEDKIEDISSGSSTSSDMEDMDISSFSSKKKRYIKKKHGITGKIGSWWSSRRLWQKSAIITTLSLVTVFAIVFGVLGIVFDYNYNRITNNPEDLGFENVINEKIVNVALFGIDARTPDSFEGLSDSIMILSLNTETKNIKLISVMRDSLVPITDNGKTTYNKINSAYKKGGPELAIKTLNTIFGLDISEYATVNFYGMTDIIDAVGGIEAELTKSELNYTKYENGKKINVGINGMILEQCNYMGLDAEDYYINKAGTQHLNGIQAVAYSRIRYAANVDGTSNDFGRTDRQRYVMEQLFNKALTLDKAKYISLAKALIPCSETSLSYSEIMGLAYNILLKSPTFEQSRVPLEKYQMPSPSTSVGSVVYYDLDFAAKLIHAFIYQDITPEDYIAQNGIEKNDWYSKRVGSSATDKKPTQSDDANVNDSSAEDNADNEDRTDNGESKVPSSVVSGGEDDSGSSSNPDSSDAEQPSSKPDDTKPDDSEPEDSSSSTTTEPEDSSDDPEFTPPEDTSQEGTEDTPAQDNQNPEQGSTTD